jgi:gentisate 1,2-dioxygenase
MDSGTSTQTQLDDLRSTPTLEELYKKLDQVDFTPGWIPRPAPILSAEPNTAFKPFRWSYANCRAALDAAGRLINTELAERRNLVMRAPVPGNNISTNRTLVSAYQMILPGEKARSHRHAPHALRVILDAKGAYSTVNGEKTPMETGDIVLTPGWHWHGHGHDGDRPAYWMDGLDVPLVHLMEQMFFEEHPDGWENVEVVTETSPNRFTWESTQRGLDKAKADPEGFHGPRIHLPAPTMPTIGIFVEKLAAGTKTRPYRTSASSIYVVMQGKGKSIIDGETFNWEFGDTISVPTWKTQEHQATEDTVLFQMSDEFLMKWAYFYRFEAM